MISMEVFAAKDVSGELQGIMLSVPVDCGLKHADTLRIHGRRLLAIDHLSILPIDFPELDEAGLQVLAETATRHGVIAVGEFTPLGLADNYLLALEIGSSSLGAAAGKDR